uniref:Uncharacterized protein n=1 Tax=Saimiri boliviensis boliviensis TaxID=39432 RepID=A0A2K6RZM5_SAIBB
TCASRSPLPPRRCHHHPKATGAASGAAAWDPSPGCGGLCRLALRPSAQNGRNNTFQTYKKEECLPGHSNPRWMHVPGTTAGRSVVTGACCPNGCSRPPTRTSCWLLQHVCRPLASC